MHYESSLPFILCCIFVCHDKSISTRPLCTARLSTLMHTQVTGARREDLRHVLAPVNQRSREQVFMKGRY